MTFSLLVGLKNNLAYTQCFYAQTRSLYPKIEIVFVSYGSTDGTHQWLDSLADNYVKYQYGNRERTLSDTYNTCIELATSAYVIFVHNDMVLTPGFIEQLAGLPSDDRVIYYTTIEPPVFADDERPGKIVQDFGSDLDTFQRDALFDFSKEVQQRNQRNNQIVTVSDNVSFFLCAAKKLLLEMGGLDPLFNPMFCEDDDLITRLRLKGVEQVVALNSICYHFVSKTSRFSAEYSHRTRQLEEQSNRNFIRKWRFQNSSPVKKTYDIGLVLTRGDLAALRALEPWCSTIYTDVDAASYVHQEQPCTAIDLRKKIKPLTAPKENGIIVKVNAQKMGPANLEKIEHLHEAIDARLARPKSLLNRLFRSESINFTWNGYRIRIIDPTSSENQLIYKQ